MSVLFLEPHHDDAVLFGCFTLLRYKPLVITVLESQVQELRGYGIEQEERAAENEAALGLLGAEWEQWPYPDSDPDWAAIEERLELLSARYDKVYAPQTEINGHPHHNQLGEIVRDVFGQRSRHYLTYTAAGKSAWGVPVAYEPAWVGLKLRALACYRSQIESAAAGCTEHFLRDQHEYLAP